MTQVCKRCYNEFTPNKDWHEFCNDCAKVLLDMGWATYKIDMALLSLKTMMHNEINIT